MTDLDLKKINFQSIVEEKEQGILRVFESKDMPFPVKRVFTVVNALGGSKRGEHAHKKCNQILCCVAGEIELICDNGAQRTRTFLTPDSPAVYVSNGVWAEQNYLKDNSVLIVFCDQKYDENDYLRNYDDFLEWKIKNE